MGTREQLLGLIAIAVAAAMAAFAAERLLPVVRVAENWAGDLRIARLTPPEPQSEDIVVVAVTEDTLAGLPYRSPLDRRFLSKLLRELESKGARLIALDMLLDQPSEFAKDQELRVTLGTLGVPLVVATAGVADGLTPRQAEFVESYLHGIPTGVPLTIRDGADGTVRGIMLRRREGDRDELGFSAAVAEALGAEVPASDTLALRFRGAPAAETPPFPVYPAHAVGLMPGEWFQGRIALVGVELDLSDRHRTPFSAAAPDATDMPGVVLQAHAIAQILEGTRGPAPPPATGILLIAVFALIGAAVVMVGIPATVKVIGLLAAAVVIWVGGFAVFAEGGPLLPVVAPTLALAFAALLTYAWRWREERAQRRFIHDAFSKYVAPSVVEHMVANPDRLRLGGERRETTFLFTDIADYTTLTENTAPDRLVDIMSHYMDGTSEIVFAHGGTLEKFVGDALHVMFNAPVDQPDHAERAVRCALELDAFCQNFAAGQREQGIAFGVTRIGVNTGVTVVGNFGGRNRFDYSATGDAINTAARLESVNKQLGTRVCVSGSTTEGCAGFVFRPVGELVLKGKSESVAAYEPVQDGGKNHCDLDDYLAAYAHMAAGDAVAVSAFERLARQWPEDPLVAFHLRRLSEGESGAVIVLKEK